jgi:hypothetical protein
VTAEALPALYMTTAPAKTILEIKTRKQCLEYHQTGKRCRAFIGELQRHYPAEIPQIYALLNFTCGGLPLPGDMLLINIFLTRIQAPRKPLL